MLQRSALRSLALLLVTGAAPLVGLAPQANAAAASPSLVPSPVPAQKLARKAVDCPTEGFKFKPLDRYDAVPVDTSAGGDEVLKMSKDQNGITVFSCGNAPGKKSKKGKSSAKGARKSVEAVIMTLSLRGLTKKKIKAAEIDEIVEIEGLKVRHQLIVWDLVKNREVGLDVWTFPLDHADIHICYFLIDGINKKAAKMIQKSAESFEFIDRTSEVKVDNSARTYGSQMAWAEQEAAKTPGWRAIGTPSERFIILTSSDKKTFIDTVIERLEVSRDVYERDFPPPAGFDAVSVIRICADQAQFMTFGKTPPGVAGYFKPSTVELVLYDNVERDRNSTYAVVGHEAFHQYCHFLFNQSEAHRWFDEGHGDYYGGMKIKGGRGKITPKMPAGLDRLGVVRQLVRTDSFTPFEDHLNFTHQQWQSSGGDTGVGNYAQSWSIIYMLREGALRNVNRKVWKDEYADIIPSYVTTLTEGFEAAYEVIREERIAKAKKRGKEIDPDELNINRFDLDPREKKKIWKAAMAASWGKIDLEEFEANWKLYVEKYLK